MRLSQIANDSTLVFYFWSMRGWVQRDGLLCWVRWREMNLLKKNEATQIVWKKLYLPWDEWIHNDWVGMPQFWSMSDIKLNRKNNSTMNREK